MTNIVAIHRHPIKGFTAEALSSTELETNGGVPFDRHFAFVSGNKEDVPTPGTWVQPRTFLMLTLYPELARFDCKLIDDDTTLQITAPDGEIATATRGDTNSFDAANAMLATHFDSGPHGNIRLVEQGNDRGNWDFSDTEISIINLATVRVISEAIGRDLEKERFRGNIYIDGLDPWEEFSWPGCRVTVGNAELDILRPVQRCAMTSTEPGTGLREIDVPKSMADVFGHHFCGVYARVRTPGSVATGGLVALTQRDLFNPHDNLPDRVAAPSLWPRFVAEGEVSGANANYTTTCKSWPMLPVEDGQSVRSHPLDANGTSQRIKLASSSTDGWHVNRTERLGPLVTGPYGRLK